MGVLMCCFGIGLLWTVSNTPDPGLDRQLWLMGVFYLPTGAAWFVPASFLLRAAFSLVGGGEDRRAQVHRTLRLQRQFWQAFALALVLLVLINCAGGYMLDQAPIDADLIGYELDQ
jgi:hypothetical protein